VSFARRIREAWRAGRERERQSHIYEWQMRLRLAKHFHQGVSEEPPKNNHFSGGVRDPQRTSTSHCDALNAPPVSSGGPRA
jgi:hypothetical protein